MKMRTIINFIFILIIITIFLKCDGYSRSNELRVNIKISNNNKTIYCRDKAQECHKIFIFLDPFFLMGSWMCGQVPHQPSCYDNEK